MYHHGPENPKKVDAKIFKILNPKTQKDDLPSIINSSGEGRLARAQRNHGSLETLDSVNQCLGIKCRRPRGLR